MKTRVTSTPRYAAAGFSLLELMVVVSIMAVILTMGIPFFKHHQNMRKLEQAEREMATVFKFARDYATSSGMVAGGTGSVFVTVTGTDVLVQTVAASAQTAPTLLRNYQGSDNTGIVLTVTDPSNGNILSSPNGDGVYVFFYASNGSLPTPPNVTLPAQIAFNLTVESTTLTFTLVPATGGVVESQ